jgi:hypothetical protein
LDKDLNSVLVYFTTIVVLSTLVVGPISVSNSYYGFAYTEEQLAKASNSTVTLTMEEFSAKVDAILSNSTSTEIESATELLLVEIEQSISELDDTTTDSTINPLLEFLFAIERLIPQAQPVKDLIVKVKHRINSEMTTVYSD